MKHPEECGWLYDVTHLARFCCLFNFRYIAISIGESTYDFIPFIFLSHFSGRLPLLLYNLIALGFSLWERF